MWWLQVLFYISKPGLNKFQTPFVTWLLHMIHTRCHISTSVWDWWFLRHYFTAMHCVLEKLTLLALWKLIWKAVNAWINRMFQLKHNIEWNLNIKYFSTDLILQSRWDRGTRSGCREPGSCLRWPWTGRSGCFNSEPDLSLRSRFGNISTSAGFPPSTWFHPPSQSGNHSAVVSKR